jgi:arylsulfatase A-like enzyme
MMRIAFIAVLAAALSLGSLPAAEPSSRSPNIVLIFVDDLGYRDTGFTGSDFYETPHIDRLASEGMIFPHAYASFGNCAPSRAVLHSGQYGPRHGVYAVGRTDRGPRALQRLVAIPNREDLPLEKITIAEALRNAGYATGLFGKWHLNGKAGTQPTGQGFGTYFDSRKNQPNRRRDEPDDPKGTFSNTRAALEFIETNRDRPFFAFISHHAPHSSLEARPATLAKFQGKQPGIRHQHALLAACIYDLDEAVGMVADRLQELELAENTLVIFTSDNGAPQNSTQEPLRGNKGGYYEGGIRVPFVAWWPGRIKTGTVNATPISNVDFYPTFLAVANASPPSGYPLDGIDLLPHFLNPNLAPANRSLFWHFPGYLDDPVIRGRDPVFRTRPVSVVRTGDWKLHLFHEEWLLDEGLSKLEENRVVELYNLASDPGERHDLALTEPEKRDELLAILTGWFERIDAPLPREPNPGYAPDAAPPDRAQRNQE